MKQQAQSLLERRKSFKSKKQDWYPQVRPIEHVHFCQISQNLYDYYRNFQAYYELNPQNQQQKLYPPAFYQYYSRKIW